MSQILDILIKARELIATPERWTKGVLGVGGDGDEIETARGVLNAAEAGELSCMCMLGALVAAEGTTCGLVLTTDEVEKALGIDFIDRFNDARDTEHADVIRLFDDAIARLRVSP